MLLHDKEGMALEYQTYLGVMYNYKKLLQSMTQLP
jgi:hypothetical protein